jgi:hypothetical protein
VGGEGWCCIALPPAPGALCVREVLQGGRAVFAVSHLSLVKYGVFLGLPQRLATTCRNGWSLSGNCLVCGCVGQ